MLYAGTDPEPYMTEYNLVYEDFTGQTKQHGHLRSVQYPQPKIEIPRPRIALTKTVGTLEGRIYLFIGFR